MIRQILKQAQLVVIKVGSKVLLDEQGRLSYPHIAHLVQELCGLKRSGKKIIFVSSGAVGAGMEALGIKSRPDELPLIQACASIGQVRLMRVYEDLFASFEQPIAQVLLTHDDLKHRKRHINIKNTLTALLAKDVIPIINENDTVATHELKFGDNDVLASLVAMLLEAKGLVLLTTTSGFMIKRNGRKEVLPHIIELNEEILSNIESHKDKISLGGMKSKLMAAINMNHVGGVAVIAPGKQKNILQQIFMGQDIGTVVGDINREKVQLMPGRKRWIAFYHKPKGVIKVDDGAKQALIKNGKSLLAVGILGIVGAFLKGDAIDICDEEGRCFAKGISQINSNDLEKRAKLRSVVIHRDDMVVL